MNDRGILATFLLSLLSKITNPEHTSQFKLIKYPISKKINDLLINKTIPVTLNNIFLRFRDAVKISKLQGDLKLMTKKTSMLILLIYRTNN